MTNEKAIERMKKIKALEVFGNDYMPVIDMAVAALERERWTSVKEALPERFEIVLLTVPGVETAVEGFLDKRSRWIVGGLAHHLVGEPTHWRPLPEIWKDETI